MDAPPQSDSELTRFLSHGPTRAFTPALLLALLPLAAYAQGEGGQSAEELAKKLSNPIARTMATGSRSTSSR
jgi:G:T/U-mismatch repair DNA glycosylase